MDESKTFSVLGCGTATVDVLLACDYLPGPDQFEMIRSRKVVPGGSCANMLVTLARLGARAGQLARIGDDSYGRLFCRDLQEMSVDTSRLITVPGGSTMHTYIFATGSGEHAIYADMGDTIMSLTPDELPGDVLEGTDLFYADLFPAPPAIHLAGLCREKGIPVVFNLQCPVPIMEKIGVSRGEILEMLSLADLFISGREGYRSLTGTGDPREAVAVLLKSVDPALGFVCTAGEEGAVWLADGQWEHCPSYPVEIRDTTGAGDSFLGALIWSYMACGESRREALKFASAAAALKCTQEGPRLQGGITGIRDLQKRYASRVCD